MMNSNNKLIVLFFFLLTGAASKAQKTDYPLTEKIGKYVDKDCTFFEVTGDMFELLAQDERIDGKVKEYVSSIDYLAFVDCNTRDSGFYKEFMTNVDLTSYTILMRTTGSQENMVFYRKPGKIWKEYLIVHDKGLQYIITKLDIKSMHEMASIMNMAGSFGAR